MCCFPLRNPPGTRGFLRQAPALMIVRLRLVMHGGGMVVSESLYLSHLSLSVFLSVSLSLAFLFLISPQADATQQRVVKREDGERLAKVSVTLKK
jgi:hypothetical protein